MDKFQAISAFIAVSDQKGFAAAAKSLGMSPPAVTRLVAMLEDHMGVRLLQRTTRMVSLTDAGSRFLERARRIMDDLAEAERHVEDERGVPSGRLSVSAPSMFGRLHVGPLACTFMNTHPFVSIELQLADRMVNLVEDGIDVAVRIGQLADSSLVARRVGATRKVVVAAPEYLSRTASIHRPEDTASHRVIAATPIGPAGQLSFHRGHEAAQVAYAQSYVTNSIDAAIWHAERNGGLVQVMAYQVVEQVRSGRLMLVLPEFEPEPLPIQFVYPTTRLLSVKVRAFIDMAKEFADWDFTDLQRVTSRSGS